MVTGWQHKANSIGFSILLGIVVLAPLPFGANRPFFWFLISALLGVLLLFWAATALASRNNIPAIVEVPFAKFKIEAGLLLVLLAWFLLQAAPLAPESWQHPVWATTAPDLSGSTAAVSATPDATMDGWVRLLGYGGVFFLAMQYGRNRNRARLALWGVALSGIAYGLYGLVIQLGGFDTILWYRRWAYHDSLTATFVNRNSFAAFGGIALICCVAALTRVERRVNRLTGQEDRGDYLERLSAQGLPLVLGAIVILTAILLSQSRAGLLATALGFMVLYLCRRWRDWERRRIGGRERQSRWRSAPLFLALGLIAVVAISGAATWKRLDRETVDDPGGRINIYNVTLKAIADRPLLGHGLGSYRWVFEGYRTPALQRASIIDKAHNSYLDFAFEAGVPAFLVLMALYGRLFIRCLNGVRRRQQDYIYPAVSVAAATLLASHSMVDFPLQIPAVTIVFLFLFGIGFAQSWSSQTP